MPFAILLFKDQRCPDVFFFPMYFSSCYKLTFCFSENVKGRRIQGRKVERRNSRGGSSLYMEAEGKHLTEKWKLLFISSTKTKKSHWTLLPLSLFPDTNFSYDA